MATNYPAGLDAFPTVGAATPMDTSGSEHDLLHNNMGDAIEALELELGAQPSGIFDSLVQRLDALRDAARTDANMIPFILDCARAYCTLYEIRAAMEDVFGAYREPVFF